MVSLRVLEESAPQAASFDDALHAHGVASLVRAEVDTLQINVGKVCNQACSHCHVEAGPKRTETMSRAVAERVLALLDANPSVRTLDITGGAPELCAQFRFLVEGARARGRDVIDRCNLTVLPEPGQEDPPPFLAAQRVRVVASLPCYLEKNVDRQRGGGVYDKSILALRRLNALGYGVPGTGLLLDLVYNPGGASLPPDQRALEADYRRELGAQHGVVFSHLRALTNVPIKRFAAQLAREGKAAAYQQLLEQSFNPGTLDGLMCRSLVSVGYDGRMYDCDFNQMLELDGPVATVFDVEDLGALRGARIRTASHCFACTAGAGSSCSGSLA